MAYYNREDSKKMRLIGDLLKKNNVPFDWNNTDFGLQLRFGWCDGDVVCHEGTFHMPESYNFPWDDGDVTREDPDMMAQLITEYYNAEQAPRKLYHVAIQYDRIIEARDANEALDLALAEIGNDEDGDYTAIAEIDRRQEWIDKYYDYAMTGLGFTHEIHFCKDVTIVAAYTYPAKIYTAAPRHGDKYNKETGIAVAYAKCVGDPVPDYI